MKVDVYFRQASADVYCVSKTIDLAVVPFPGAFIEYEDGWALAEVCERLSVHITADTVSLDGYGVQFTPEEIEDLEALGWTVERRAP